MNWILITTGILMVAVACSGQVPDHTSSAVPDVTKLPNGQWFVPAGSGLGPPLSQVKAFVLYNGDVCLHVPLRPVASMDEIVGLRCVPELKSAENRGFTLQ